MGTPAFSYRSTAAADALGLDPSTTGRQVTALRENGLVERMADSQDRRRGIVSATAGGRAQLAHTRARRRERTAELLRGWSEEDLRTLGGLLVKYDHAVARDYFIDRPQGTPTVSAVA